MDSVADEPLSPKHGGYRKLKSFQAAAAGDAEYRRGQPCTVVCRSGSAKTPGKHGRSL